MKKIIVRALCTLLCVLLMPICFSSCGEKAVFSLGPYKINEDHYKYLASIHNRQQFASYNISIETPWEATFPSGLTVAQAIDATTSDFLNDVYMLLYSQLLFDAYELEIPQSMLDTIENNVKIVVNYYGGYSEQKFDSIARGYGFTADTIREVYKMQAKQSLVVEHLYGASGEKIPDEKLNEIYEKNYLRFQTIVINNVYKIVTETNEKGEKVSKMEPLTEREIAERNNIIDDLSNLFISPQEGYTYKVIDPTKSYEELYAIYSDDKAYPQGCYSPFPSSVSSQNAITAAALLKENDVARVKAKRFFSQGGSFDIGGETITIQQGDYFEYGYVFVKRLPMTEKAYNDERYVDFFSTFKSSAVSVLYAEHVSNFQENETNQQIKDYGIREDIPLSSVAPNDLDYNYLFNASQENE